jgi:hypothetical protein
MNLNSRSNLPNVDAGGSESRQSSCAAAKPVLTPTGPIDWASAIDVTDAGGFADCLISNRRHDARPKNDACSCDATCRIIDILAVHYGTGLVGAYSYESGYQKRR